MFDTAGDGLCRRRTVKFHSIPQLPTIVFWEYREVYIIVDNLAYILSNVRCLVDAMIIILFFTEITSLG